ncbi:hypothetical protein [Streptomyces sp. CB01881]|uniref:hypothetical protein n=1 Tax=Streptomyces sp. CB01881 TaxID=2078691 RepID=UPI000CDC99CE|nr:hypothetical protein [Streptomyces sp. CB01881]AUY48024.1 hypothetical protein C2142_02485 [Streptomyces sp. CB01881]TYC76504.1 hypothetical protein EH183_02495 [Streptomyces sp. CB01881]
MNRLTLLAAGVAGAATLLAIPAEAGAATATTTTTTVTCGASGLQAGLSTKVCAEITGTGVAFYGQISLAGPPSPGSPELPTRQLLTGLSGQVVGGASLGSVSGGTLFKASTVQVRGVSGTVTCGSTVHGSFSVADFPWNPAPVTVDVVVPC